MSNIKIILLSLVLFMTSCAYVDPTEVTLRVQELGNDAGEVTIMDIPGRYSIAGWSASDYSFPITEQNYRFTAGEDKMFSSEEDESIQLQIEGNDCTLDVGMRFYIDNTNKEGLKFLVTKYPTSLDGVVDGLMYEVIRGAVKDACQGQTLDWVMDNLPDIMRGEVTDKVAQTVKSYAIEVVEIYDISGLNVPQGVKEAKELTQESTQKIKRAEEDKIEQAIRDSITINSAIAKAEATRILNRSEPSDRVLKAKMIEKWNGVEAIGSNVIVMEGLK